jgi:hypothetical protein
MIDKTFQAHEAWKQAGIAILITEKSRLQTKNSKNRQRRSLNINKGNSTKGGFSYGKHLCAKRQCIESKTMILRNTERP